MKRKSVLTILLIVVFSMLCANIVFVSADEVNTNFTFYQGKYDNFTKSDKLYDENIGTEDNQYTINDYKTALYKTTSHIEGRDILTGTGGITGQPYVAVATSDDPIVKIIPRELFANNGDFLYIGEEYGFFVHTENLTLYSKKSTAYVFDIIKYFGLVDPRPSQLSIKIKPIFQYNYFYLTNQYDEDIPPYCFGVYGNYPVFCVPANGATPESLVIPAPFFDMDYIGTSGGGTLHYTVDYSEDTKYFIKDSTFAVVLRNESELNIGDQGYTNAGDMGSFIIRAAIEYDGVAKNGEYNVNGNELENIYATASYFLGYVPGLGEIISMTELFAELLSNDYEAKYIQKSNVNYTSNDYYASKREQIENYGRLNKVAYVSQTSSEKPILFGRTKEGDFIEARFTLSNEDYIAAQSWYTRVNSLIKLEIVKNIGSLGNVQSIVTQERTFQDFVREENVKEISNEDLETTVCLLPGGRNLFRFTPNMTDKYVMSTNGVGEYANIRITDGDKEILNTFLRGLNEDVFFVQGHTYNFEINYVDPSDSGNFELFFTPECASLIDPVIFNLTPGSMKAFSFTPLSSHFIPIYRIYSTQSLEISVKDGNTILYQETGHYHYVKFPTKDKSYTIVLENTGAETQSGEVIISDVPNVVLGQEYPVEYANEFTYYKINISTPAAYSIIGPQGCEYDAKSDAWQDVSGILYPGHMMVHSTLYMYNTYYLGVKAGGGTFVISTYDGSPYVWCANGEPIYDNEFEMERGMSIEFTVFFNGTYYATSMIFDQDITGYVTFTSPNTVTVSENAPITYQFIVERVGNQELKIHVIPNATEIISMFTVTNNDYLSLNWVNQFAELDEIVIRISAPNGNYKDYRETGLSQNNAHSSSINLIYENFNDTINLITAPQPEGFAYTGIDNLVVSVLSVKFIGMEQVVDYNQILTIPTTFAGGSGTETDPYQISSYRHLDNIRLSTSSHYVITSDITVPTSKYWETISSFYGVLDGQNKTISGFNLTNTNVQPTTALIARVGIVGYNSGTIKNFILNEASIIIDGVNRYELINSGFIAGYNNGTISSVGIRGSYYTSSFDVDVLSKTGGICGVNNGTVTGCSVYSAVIEVTMGSVGGIVGENNGALTNCEVRSTQIKCYSEYTDTSNMYMSSHYANAGGIVGHAQRGEVDGCIVDSSVTVKYVGATSTSTTLKPRMGKLAGKAVATTLGQNTVSGSVDIGNLNASLGQTQYATGSECGELT